MSLLTPNDYIKAMEAEKKTGLMLAEKLVFSHEWEKIKEEFIAYTERKFLTRYVQDQIYRYNRYSLIHEMLPDLYPIDGRRMLNKSEKRPNAGDE